MGKRRVPLNASVLHCIATYIFCGLLVIFSVVADLVITPLLLSTPLDNEGDTFLHPPSHVKAAQRLHSGALEVLGDPVTRLTNVPWSATNPLGFLVLTSGVLALLMPLCIVFRWLYSSIFNFPHAPTIRRRLRMGRSTIGNNIAKSLDHFDNAAFVGSSAQMGGIQVCALLGGLLSLWLASQYLWILSLRDLSLPAANVLFYSFVFVVALCRTPPLRNEGISFFKLFCATLSWIGCYIFYFPSVSKDAPPPESDLYKTTTLFGRGLICSFLACVALAMYLVFYRRLNPPGYMAWILGQQGLGVLVVGGLFMGILHSAGVERLKLPSTRSDVHTILLHGVFRGLQLFALNEALRWGDSFCVASSVPIIPAVSYLLEGFFEGEEAGYVVTHSKCFAVLCTAGSCGLLCSWYLMQVSALRTRIRWGKLDEEDSSTEEDSLLFSNGEDSDAPLLVVGPDYQKFSQKD